MQKVTVTKWSLHDDKPSTGLEYTVLYDRAIGVKKIVSVLAVEKGKAGGIDITERAISDMGLDAVIETITDWDAAYGTQREDSPRYNLAKSAMLNSINRQRS